MSTFVCSDLHGAKPIYDRITRFTKPSDVVYFLGDANDRGEHGLWLIKEILNNPQWVYICGNHEDMLRNAAIDYIFSSSYVSNRRKLLFQNGGEKTFSDWVKTKDEQLIEQIEALPKYKKYTNTQGQHIILTHAGCTPVIENDTVHLAPYFDLLWDRDHIYDDPTMIPENYVVVHGHTPISSIKYVLRKEEHIPKKDVTKMDSMFWYAQHKKLGIDLGTYVTGKACLVNLDTWEEHIFEI